MLLCRVLWLEVEPTRLADESRPSSGSNLALKNSIHLALGNIRSYYLGSTYCASSLHDLVAPRKLELDEQGLAELSAALHGVDLVFFDMHALGSGFLDWEMVSRAFKAAIAMGAESGTRCMPCRVAVERDTSLVYRKSIHIISSTS